MTDIRQFGSASKVGDGSAWMNRLTLKFSDPALEKDFLDDYSCSILSRVRISVALGFLLYAVFGLLDSLVIPDVRHMAWFIRYAVVCPLLAAVFVSTYFSWFRRIMPAVTAFSVLVAGMGIVAMIESSGAPSRHSYYGGLILVIMFAYILSGLRFVNAAAVSSAIVTAYISITMLNENAYSVSYINNYFFFISSNIVGMLSGYLVERHIRRNFLQNRCISEMVDELRHEELKRKTALDTLQESEEKYHAIMESAGDAIIIADPAGKLLEVNRQATDLFGYAKEELCGMHLADLHPDEEKRKVDECFREIGRVRRYSLNHAWINGKDGRRIPVDIAASVVPYGGKEVVICIFRNITPYREMEEALREYQENLEGLISERTAALSETVDELNNEVSERRRAEETLSRNKIFLHSIFDNIMDGITVIDNDLNILMVNKTIERWFPDKMPIRFKEKKCFQVFHDRDQQCESCLALKAMETGTGQMKTFLGSLDGGQQIGREVYAFPFRDDSGSIVGSIEYVRDVTARLEAEESARRTHHLAQLGQLSAGIAHEINNPNNVIMCNSQLLSDIWDDSLRILLKHYAENGDFLLAGNPFSETSGLAADTILRITKCSRRIDDIVLNLKDYAGQGRSGDFEAFSLNTAVANALMITGSLVRKHTDRLLTDFSTDLPQVFGCASALEQVVVNLLTNALQALPDRSRGVYVSTRSDEEGGQVILQITDEGTGMTREIQEKIFEPFFTTRYVSGGTGLGLSIAHTITLNHDGVLDFQSTPGAGTTVRLILPAAGLQGCRPARETP